MFLRQLWPRAKECTIHVGLLVKKAHLLEDIKLRFSTELVETCTAVGLHFHCMNYFSMCNSTLKGSR